MPLVGERRAGERARTAQLPQLDPSHGRVVAGARAELEDAEIAAVAVRVPRRNLREELVGHVLVVDARDHLALLVQAALLGLRDELFWGRGADPPLLLARGVGC